MPEITHDSSHVEQHSPNSLAAKRKTAKVMHEWGQGNLKTSAGKKVISQKQAVAIALSEARRNPYKK